MTICELIMKPIVRMVEEEKKDLDDIANVVCPKIEYGKEKIIRVIKDFLGEQYLIDHADILHYNVEMAQLAKKRKSHKKIDAKQNSDLEEGDGRKLVITELKKLINKYSLASIKDALAVIESGNTKDDLK